MPEWAVQALPIFGVIVGVGVLIELHNLAQIARGQHRLLCEIYFKLKEAIPDRDDDG